MFEAMLTKVVRPKDVVWDSPKYLHVKINPEDEKYDTCEILKGADIFLHKQLDLKPSTSKEVYKKAETIWKELKDEQLRKAKDNPDPRAMFYLTKPEVLYLMDDYKNVVDVFDARNEDAIKEFEDQLEKFTLDITTHEKTDKFFTDGKGGLVKLVFYRHGIDLTKEDYTPVVILEYNNEKSQYKLYTGILIYNTFTFIPNISIFSDTDTLSDFIKRFDIDEVLKYSEENAKGLYESYLQFKENAVEISARELISLLKKVGYKLQLKTDDQLDAIEAIQDSESNEKIQEFFNTFTLTTGETAYDILSLSELKKIFRYNKLTLLEVLAILSKEYLTYDGSKITADVLSSIVFNLYDKQNDKRQAESIKNEIEKN